ncbi:pilus assembly protein TadG-related protein [Hyphobacterium marinum]|uniref:Pilus assembly protein TadG-related protein n=1 Tax=Hyphobacterium marinum TaxID=3116574 RepID=A0ABU7M1I4_9PROT|nr:pilus assembly protein TadG-related protein [Hyphobacterium sp. Y6023]MEE2567671.1 pilus assembly protein TadG-related protein [Hyphobacterium sp. Y6023]
MKIFDKIRRFFSDTGGNVATIFALTLTPIAILSGGAIDVSQAMNSRARLAEAMDAAALAVGGQINLTDAEASRVAWDYINANYPEREVGSVQAINVHIDRDNGVVTVTGESRVQTTLLGLMGMDDITVHWESEVQQSRQALELAMVLDNTGSMRGSKISALRDAALLLTDVLYSNGDPDRLRISLVPFAATVNVGRDYERVWWLDPDGESPVHAEWAGEGQDVRTCTGRGRRRVCTTETIQAINWDLFDSLRNTSWAGCVEARMLPYDIEDEPADASRPETLFVPYFAPDEPDIGNFHNDYLNDDRGTDGIVERITGLLKYDGGRPSGGDPNRACTTTPITPLTNSRRTIENAIRDMGASGNTNIPNGIGWGVRVLSPQEPFTDGAEFGDRDTLKAMVILTDGENVMSGNNGYFMSEYSAYGYAVHGRLGRRTASSGQLSDALDERTAAACRYAREQGIRVYTITFQVNSSSTRNMMRDCASHPSLYFDSPSSSALREAFNLIAGDLSNLRLSR